MPFDTTQANILINQKKLLNKKCADSSEGPQCSPRGPLDYYRKYQQSMMQ